MIRFFLLISFYLSFCVFCNAQEFSVSGLVVDHDNNPLPYATVVLKTLDSVLYKGVSTLEGGNYALDNIKKGEYYVQASYIGNESALVLIEVNRNLKAKTIQLFLNNQNLDEVIVTLEKPRLERKADRLVFNILNTALADSDIWNVLKKTPSVLISGEKIQIKGQGNIGVMINNRKVNLPPEDLYNLLSGTSANNVESIEVITNPPLKYSAEGGMLLNIVMQKNLETGYKGSIFNTYKQGVFAKHTLGTDHYLKGESYNFSANYSFSRNKGITRYTDITNYIGEPSSIWSANQNSTLRENKHNLSVFFDSYINEKTTLSLSSHTVVTPKYMRMNANLTDISYVDETLDTNFETLILSDREYFNSAYYLDWIRKLNKEGSEISFGSHYTFYDSKIGQRLNTTFFDPLGDASGTNNFSTQSNQKINLYHAQLDFSTPIGNTSTLETGLRFAHIFSESTIVQEGFNRNQPGINPTEAAVFLYDEDIFAAYSSFNSNQEKVKLNAGLRMEYTKTIGELDTSADATVKKYLEWFPSFSLNYAATKKDNLKLYYFRRITRPRYNKINPFQYFENNNSVIEGNPDLLPATRNYIALEYTFNKAYGVEIFYRAEKNSLREQVFQDNESNLLRYLMSNIDKDISYGIDFTLNKKLTNFWDSYVMLHFAKIENEFVDFNSQELLKADIWSWLVRTRNSFNLLADKTLMADLDFVYYAPTIFGNTQIESNSNLSLAIRKTIWNKKASISLGMSDIFRKDTWLETRRYRDQDNTTFQRRENRIFNLGFRYKFGDQKIKGNSKSKRNAERGRI